MITPPPLDPAQVMGQTIDPLYGQVFSQIASTITIDTALQRPLWLSDVLPMVLDILKTIALFLTLLFGGFFLYAISKLMTLPGVVVPKAPEPGAAQPEPAKGGAFTARWEEIMRHMDSAKEAEWKFALIEADKLVDLVLQRAGFSGDTMGEKLMNIQPGQIQNLDGVWEAHKIRNRIAHDVGYFLRYTEAKQAIEKFAVLLRELGAIA